MIRVAYNVSVLALAATAAGALVAPLNSETGATRRARTRRRGGLRQYSVNLILITAVIAVSSHRSFFALDPHERPLDDRRRSR